MKIIVKLIIVFFITFCSTSCSLKREAKIIQLSNQSYSQMMSYIIEDQYGTIIVVDGGTKEDLPNLLQTIKKNSKSMTVKAWFLTHYHKDHTGALAEYLNSDGKDLKIDNIYYNFPDEEMIKKYESNRFADYEIINKELEKLETNKKIKAGDTYKFKGTTVDVIREYNSHITNNFGNNSSVVLKVQVENNSILFLGDLGIEGGNELVKKYSNYIENMDYVQMAHHGQAGVDKSVYEIINPKYCLWPTPSWLWENENKVYETHITKEWMQDLNIEKNYIANQGNLEIILK